MTDRIIGPRGGKRRRRFLFATLASVGALGAVLVTNALAVHEEQFQLDGNALSTLCGTTPDGGPSGPNACQTQIFDWGKPEGNANANNIFNTTNSSPSVNTAVVNPLNTTGFTAAGFNRDFGVQTAQNNCSLTNTASTNFCTADTTTFATGSKDIQNISGGGADQAGNWQCNRDANVNSKIDIMNAYSAVYIDPSSGDKIIYFGLEKNKDNGTNNAAFWFLQGDASCSSAGGAEDFSGNHQNGDVLVTSAFSSGGGVSSILVFRWAGGANGCIDSNPAAAPACDQQPIASGADCKDVSGSTLHNVCATTNSGAKATTGNITVPWLTADATLGVGHTVVPPDFFEGGINITKVFQGTGGGAPSCFNTFIADTRSSTSAPATLFDFSRGSLGECRSTTETTPVDNSGNSIPAGGLDIPKDPADAAIQVKDKATVTVTGVNSFNGTLTFHLCGPFAAGSSTLCGTGGVLVDTQTITANGTYTSAAATVTQAGRYCWRADFTSTTSGVPPSSDSRASECFTVNPVKPTLTTEAGAGPVNFGQPVTDTATLTGTAHKPGTGGPAGSTNGSINPATLGGDATGLITFTLYKDTPGPNNCSVLATGTGTNPQTVSVSGDGTYGPVSFTPDAPGLYHWVATYPATHRTRSPLTRSRAWTRTRTSWWSRSRRRSRQGRVGSRTTPPPSPRLAATSGPVAAWCSACTTPRTAPAAFCTPRPGRSPEAARRRR